MVRRALEQEARVGAAQLGLDLAICRQRQRRRARLLELHAQRIDVMADSNATTGHDGRLPSTDRRVNAVVCSPAMPRRTVAADKRVATKTAPGGVRDKRR